MRLGELLFGPRVVLSRGLRGLRPPGGWTDYYDLMEEIFRAERKVLNEGSVLTDRERDLLVAYHLETTGEGCDAKEYR